MVPAAFPHQVLFHRKSEKLKLKKNEYFYSGILTVLSVTLELQKKKTCSQVGSQEGVVYFIFFVSTPSSLTADRMKSKKLTVILVFRAKSLKNIDCLKICFRKTLPELNRLFSLSITIIIISIQRSKSINNIGCFWFIFFILNFFETNARKKIIDFLLTFVTTRSCFLANNDVVHREWWGRRKSSNLITLCHPTGSHIVSTWSWKQ